MMKSTAFGGACAALCLLASLPAAAQDAAPWYAAKSDGDWLVRLRGIAVLPDENLDADSGALGGSAADADIDDAYVPELDFTYFFTPNLAVELILATTPHDVKGAGTLNNLDLGEVWLLPPTLTAQYHVTQLGDWTGVEGLSKLKPYFGAGVNYTIFYNTDAGQFNDIEYDNAFGFALQAGLDYEVATGVFLNLDVKKIFLETEWELDASNAGLGTQTGDVTLDPWIIGVGVGYRF
jgi:outer membrane protein